jgi:arylsulfatase A-like enzyme
MLMSGRYLYRVYDKLKGVQTLPMSLGEAGYVTFGTGKWHNEKEAFADSFQIGRSIFFGGMSDHFRIEVSDLQEGGSFSAPENRGYSTEVFVEAALQFLTEYSESDRERPFFAYVSFSVPHDPRTPPGEFLEMYNPQGIPLPPDFMPVHPFHTGWMTGRDEQLAPWPRTPEDIRSSLAEYYGLISHLDRQVGRILTLLKETSLYENTLIIFTSDHGLAIGSHGLLGKQNLYEHSMKSPLVLCGPGIPEGAETDALAYLLDLYPTINGLLGLPAPEGVDGLDLTPVIKGEAKGVRTSLFTAYESSQRAIRDQNWKLIRYPDIHYTQLFDLAKDPYELDNLSGKSEYQARVDEMMQLLAKWQSEVGDEIPLTAEVRKPSVFDYKSIHREPDRHQPEYIRNKYFKK